ncbi:MAG: extracellular solute-binding protein, partial [Chthoniobacterales bacterium]
LALAVIIGVPFLLRPKQNQLAQADDSLVIITPNNEAIRFEFTRAFSEYYQKKTGRTIRIDWRLAGGTSDITMYINSQFFAAFQNSWQSSGKAWTSEVQNAFRNSSIKLPENSSNDNPAQAARRAFLASNAGIGIDLFFGGGSYDFNKQANMGQLVDSGLIAKLPEVFSPDSIPEYVSGGIFYDPLGRWLGTCVSSFGICYNTDSIRRLGVATPTQWNNLSNPLFKQQVALADPTKSGSACKAFEMILQQQMQMRVADNNIPVNEAVAQGWYIGFQLIQKIAANARYFTDSGTQVPMDVSQGNAAIGMCIDFYGRFQSEAVAQPDGFSRLQYFTPKGGSSIDVDPIGLLRGAAHRDAALLFMDFVLSMEGQKLWNFKVGTPGGPTIYALRRLPVRKELYAPEFTHYRSDPTVDPYADAKDFTYHEEWTAPVFNVIAFVVRVMCMDTSDELQTAWQALITANFPPKATACFSDLSVVTYAIATSTIRDTLKSSDKIKELQLATELGNHFRAQYRQATELARKGE